VARGKAWSFIAGEKGRNRVRVFERASGDLFLEWLEPDEDGVQRKKRAKLDHRDKEKAIDQAKTGAAKLLLRPEPVSRPRTTASLSIRRLLEEYNTEVSPQKGDSKAGHDKRARRLFLAFFESQRERTRRPDRHPSTLDRVDWDRFIAARRSGSIAGWNSVKDRQVQYDLKYMVAVLNWALGVRDGDGDFYLLANPWSESIRRTQKWPMPKETSPLRVAMTDEARDRLIAHSPSWQFSLALIMERHTRRRNNQIRQLLWSDLDLEGRRIRWRGETDKSGKANWAPMPIAVRDAITALAPDRKIGEVPLFPSASDEEKPTPRNTFQIWLRRAKDRSGVDIRGLGFHSEKRSGRVFATRFSARCRRVCSPSSPAPVTRRYATCTTT